MWQSDSLVGPKFWIHSLTPHRNGQQWQWLSNYGQCELYAADKDMPVKMVLTCEYISYHCTGRPFWQIPVLISNICSWMVGDSQTTVMLIIASFKAEESCLCRGDFYISFLLNGSTCFTFLLCPSWDQMAPPLLRPSWDQMAFLFHYGGHQLHFA